MIKPGANTESPAYVFNSVILASSIVAADEIGLLQEIKSAGSVEVSSFIEKNNIQERPFSVLTSTLCSYKVLIIKGSAIIPGEYFMDFFLTKGYFLWLVKGYSHVLENLGSLLTVGQPDISTVHRNNAAIAKAGKDYGANFVNPYFNRLAGKFKPHMVIDIGCGSADRLIDIARKNHNTQCIGIDINPDVVKLARANVRDAKLESKIEILCGDINNLAHHEKFQHADLLISFFMGHDLWPKERCLKVFRDIKRLFPNAANFLLCDTYKPESPDISSIFALGFDLVHACMGQYIPTYKEWLDLFEELQWEVSDSIAIDIPNSVIFNLKCQP